MRFNNAEHVRSTGMAHQPHLSHHERTSTSNDSNAYVEEVVDKVHMRLPYFREGEV